MTIEDKAWGRVQHVWQTPYAHWDRLEIVAGGYSSKHVHACLENVFHVESGKLEVRYLNSALQIIETYHLTAGQRLCVPPQQWHQFYAPTACILHEFYHIGHSLSAVLPQIWNAPCARVERHVLQARLPHPIKISDNMSQTGGPYLPLSQLPHHAVVIYVEAGTIAASGTTGYLSGVTGTRQNMTAGMCLCLAPNEITVLAADDAAVIYSLAYAAVSDDIHRADVGGVM